MSLGYIAALKELVPETYQPLMLVELNFNNSTTSPTMLYLSSHMLSATDDGGGGFQYNGNDYLPRLANTEQSATQALSDQGIDRPSQVTITIKDPSRFVYQNFEQTIGFKGATMVVRFVLWQVGTANFSTDSYVGFRGTCQQASAPDDTTLTVTAVSKLQMAQISLPAVHIEPTCPWTFPQTPAQRQDGADNAASPYYECGYAPDATGSNTAGNFAASTTLASAITAMSTVMSVGSVTGTLPATPFPAVMPSGEVVIVLSAASSPWTIGRAAQGTAALTCSGGTINIPYPSCNKTRAACMQNLGNNTVTSPAADGDIAHDLMGRGTGRFGGVQWQPAASVTSRGFISGKWELIVNNSNQAKYGDIVPLAYGTTWVNALVLNVTGDANYTAMEVLCCYGQIPYVYDVVVNGVLVPHAGNDAILTGVPSGLSGNNIAGGFWLTVNDGRRGGSPSTLNFYNSQGDPYGSLAVLVIQVPIQLAAANSIPSVQILFDGPMLRVYSSPTAFTLQYTSNPAWVIMDILFWAGWTAAEMDITSFINAAYWLGTQINYTNKSGQVTNVIESNRPFVGTVPYARRDVSLAQRQPIAASDLLRSVRNNAQCLLLPNEAGLLALVPKVTLADQQSAQVTLNGQVATNATSTIPSFKFDGTLGSGYPAYIFNESNIAKDRNGNSTFKILTRTFGDSPNSTSITFQDAENQYNSDGLTVIDTEDTARIGGQQVQGSFQVTGLNTYDRAQRTVNTWMAENLRGNQRNSATGSAIGDTGGTTKIEFETSMKAIHLSVTHIIQVSNAQYGISGWLFRVTSIQPAMNVTRLKIQASLHYDAWYLDSFGQQNAPLYQRPVANARLPYSWAPGLEFPQPGDSMFLPTEGNMQLYASSQSSVAQVTVAGIVPVNQTQATPQPPVITMQAATASTGGTIPGGSAYFIGISAKDVAGAAYTPSLLSSRIALVTVPASTNTNTITVNITYWDPAAAGYVVFAGTSPQKMTYQAMADFSGSKPSTITLTAYNQDSWGAPDQFFQNVRCYPRRAYHAGIIGAVVSSVTTNSITLATLPWAGLPTNGLIGYDCSLLGLVANGVSSGTPIPIWNASITSNNVNTIFFGPGLDGNTPDPTSVPRGDGSLGLKLNDIIVIRPYPATGRIGVDPVHGNYISDANWSNAFNPLQLPVYISAITNANPAVVTTATPHGYTTDDTIYIQNMTGMTGFPLAATVKVINTTTFELGGGIGLGYAYHPFLIGPVDTTSFGAYSGSGGYAQKFSTGLDAANEPGRNIRFISGTARGTVVPIKFASPNFLYIVGNWPVTPDSTSRYIVEEASNEGPVESNPVTNSNIAQEVALNCNVSAFDGQVMSFFCVAVDDQDNESLYFNSPVRDMFFIGGVGSIPALIVGAPVTPGTIGAIAVDSTTGNVVKWDTAAQTSGVWSSFGGGGTTLGPITRAL